MENLKDFMLLFRMDITVEQPTPQQIGEMQRGWGGWIGGIAAQAKLVSTNRLGFDGREIDPGKVVSNGPNKVGTKTISGYLVLKATDMDEATAIAIDCPILAAGGSVEVRDTIPM